mgnify:CR=1 FL=1
MLGDNNERPELGNIGVNDDGEIEFTTTACDKFAEQTNFIGFGTTEPVDEDSAITFKCKDIPVIDIKINGDVYIKGELIDNNEAVYSALLDFLEDSGYLDNWKRSGF